MITDLLLEQVINNLLVCHSQWQMVSEFDGWPSFYRILFSFWETKAHFSSHLVQLDILHIQEIICARKCMNSELDRPDKVYIHEMFTFLNSMIIFSKHFFSKKLILLANEWRKGKQNLSWTYLLTFFWQIMKGTCNQNPWINKPFNQAKSKFIKSKIFLH